MTDKVTLINLLTFFQEENEVFNFDKLIIQECISNLNDGFFYLGGQVNMKANDTINLDCIKQVREINKKREIEYGGPCNSFEMQSVMKSLKQLELIESMIIKYSEIMSTREKREYPSNYI